jgi:FtsP/CotA-like multicopper oxidase with cupredoxin domain
MASGYLGPTIRARRGQRVRIEMLNGLAESTIIHWHGLHVPEKMDGHPRFAVDGGRRYMYEFSVDNRAGTYWYHPHPHGRTGKQVYAGMAGLFIVSDDEETAVGLPSGAEDLSLVIQDRQFDADNQFVYLGGAGSAGPRAGGGMMGRGMMSGGMGGGMGSMMAGMMGVLGERLLVNGAEPREWAVARRPHRLRLLNGSNTRTLKLAWADGTPLVVIGSDGGLLAAPLRRDYVMLAPAERIELWVDFGRWSGNSRPTLRSLAFDGGIDMGGMMGGAAALPDGAAFDLQHFKVGDEKTVAAAAPARLSTIGSAEPNRAVNPSRPKVFEMTMGMMAWGINGESFDMLGASELETVKLGTHEVWEFRNDGRRSMMGMVMPHSMHVHGLQFRILGRSMSRGFARDYASVKDGFVDEGWKDTVLVMPGERVQILLGFADHPGLFLYHCHMLEHEDQGLMRNYRVVV